MRVGEQENAQRRTVGAVVSGLAREFGAVAVVEALMDHCDDRQDELDAAGRPIASEAWGGKYVDLSKVRHKWLNGGQ